MASTPPNYYWLLTYPRTASNLLVRMLNLEEQDSLLRHENNEYFFLPTLEWRYKHRLCGVNIDEWIPDKKVSLKKAYQDSHDDLDKLLSSATNSGKNVFVKEHVSWFTDPVAETRYVFGEGSTSEKSWMVETEGRTRTSLNATVFSDEFLQRWMPTFLIRHPALAMPSLFRVWTNAMNAKTAYQDPSHAVEMTLHWSRTLYDWYRQHLNNPIASDEPEASWPIILDADDIMNSPNVMIRYASILGLDPQKLKFTWNSAQAEEMQSMPSIRKKMLATLHSSTGVMEDKAAANITIEDEARKWRQEFGDEAGAQLEKWVRAAMPDYEYLKSRRLKSDE